MPPRTHVSRPRSSSAFTRRLGRDPGGGHQLRSERASAPQTSDFVAIDMLDRDAGCFEAPRTRRASADGTCWYWDEEQHHSPQLQGSILSLRQGRATADRHRRKTGSCGGRRRPACPRARPAARPVTTGATGSWSATFFQPHPRSSSPQPVVAAAPPLGVGAGSRTTISVGRRAVQERRRGVMPRQNPVPAAVIGARAEPRRAPPPPRRRSLHRGRSVVGPGWRGRGWVRAIRASAPRSMTMVHRPNGCDSSWRARWTGQTWPCAEPAGSSGTPCAGREVARLPAGPLARKHVEAHPRAAPPGEGRGWTHGGHRLARGERQRRRVVAGRLSQDPRRAVSGPGRRPARPAASSAAARWRTLRQRLDSSRREGDARALALGAQPGWCRRRSRGGSARGRVASASNGTAVGAGWPAIGDSPAWVVTCGARAWPPFSAGSNGGCDLGEVHLARQRRCACWRRRGRGRSASRRPAGCR